MDLHSFRRFEVATRLQEGADCIDERSSRACEKTSE